jgi:hypothetical protein
MATLEEVAPDLAPYITVAEAKALPIPAPPGEAAPKPPTTEKVRKAVELLKWVGARWIPADAPEEVRGGLGVSDVARKTGLDLGLCQLMHAQVKAAQAEAAKGADAFKPSPKDPTPVDPGGTVEPLEGPGK